MIPATLPGRVTALLLAAAVLYFGAVLAFQIALIADPDYQSAGVALLFKYRLLGDPQAFGDDYLASFAAAFSHPRLYEAITRLWLEAGGDLVVLHRVIPLFCWLAFLGGMAVAARSLGDRVTLVAAVGLAAAQPLYLLQITAALPHAFGFPLLIWAFVALLRGTAGGLAAITLLAALLYPAIAPLTGLLLAWQVLVAGRLWRQRAADQAKGAILVAAVGAVALWLLLEAIAGPAQFGPALAPGEKADLYPENGPRGQYAVSVFDPLTYLAVRVFFQFHDVFADGRLLLLLLYGCVGLYGMLTLPKASGGRAALLAFVVCALVASLAVLVLRPHFIYRFAFYPAFTLLPLFFVLGVQQFCRRLAGLRRAPEAAALVVVLLFALSLNSFNARNIGYLWHFDARSRQVIDFAAAQPPGSRFAIWPERTNRFELIPYLSRRPLLVMLNFHSPSYESHLLEMRRRMSALIEAYLATDAAPLRALHCAQGVDFLVVDRAHFVPGAAAPWYLPPFDRRIAELWRANGAEGLLLRAPPPNLVALKTEDHFVLRLAGPCPAEVSRRGAAAPEGTGR